jgi:short-subunit dehydrogenase
MSRNRRLELCGSTALVTGASAGIGLAVARRLARKGANLVIAARRPEKLEEAAASLLGLGVKVLAVPTDVGRREDLDRLVETALREFQTIDVLVNNAGIEAFCHFADLPPERIEETIRVNLTSALLLTRLVVPHMLAAGRGHVVNMSSTAGKLGPPFAAVYATTKAGLVAFTQSLRAEYRNRGISASVICPGFADDGGIYDRMKTESGRHSPALIGSTTADRVARAVIRAVENDRPELIVNSPPLRPIAVLLQMFPSLGASVVRAASVRFLKRVADSHRL